MIKAIISGCFGQMGRSLCELIENDSGMVIAAGVDRADSTASFPVFKTFDELEGKADVIIDFSNPSNLEPLLRYAVKTETPCVIATTGLSREQIGMIEDSAVAIPVFFTANMSVGINLLQALVRQAAAVLGDSFDIEIVEKHHSKKLDAPSGTALMLADSVSDCLSYSPEYIYDRHSRRQTRDKREVGIHTLRGGTIVGEHDVIFAGEDEIITLSHSARSKKVFAAGAVKAAKYIITKSNGLYSMHELLSELNSRS